jgi:predicted glycosyltransferase
VERRAVSARVFFYVQHLLGIGHLARASRIASALAREGFAVTVATGGAPVAGFPGPDVRTVALPPVLPGAGGFADLTDSEGRPVDEAFRTRRCALLLDAFGRCAPDVVITEAFPFGRRQMRFELLPLLEAIRTRPSRPLLVASVRDILQERSKPGRDEETAGLVDRHFDRVLVHGDPRFARLEDTFPLAAAIAGKVDYTGLVAPPAAPPSPEAFDVVVSAGGGAAGNALVQAAVAAAALMPGSLRWCVVAGPNLPPGDWEALRGAAPPAVRVERYRPDLPALLASARVSLSQAGYNTVCDLLRAGCRAVLVPFAAGGETEQTVRAGRLERLGLATVVSEAALTAAGLRDALERALASPPPPPSGLDLDGAARTAALLADLLAKRSRSA